MRVPSRFRQSWRPRLPILSPLGVSELPGKLPGLRFLFSFPCLSPCPLSERSRTLLAGGIESLIDQIRILFGTWGEGNDREPPYIIFVLTLIRIRVGSFKDVTLRCSIFYHQCPNPFGIFISETDLQTTPENIHCIPLWSISLEYTSHLAPMWLSGCASLIHMALHCSELRENWPL